MGGVDGLFLDACGARGPLQLEWDDWETGAVLRCVLERPAALVGRNPKSDFRLDHPRVGRRHAYLQLIEGRLFAIDLESRDGLRWFGVPRQSGWIDRRRPMQLGPTTIRVVEGDRDEDEEPGAGPGPISRRFMSRHPLPDVVLEIQGTEGGPRHWPMDRVLALVGSSEHCTVQLLDPGTSRYACALVRTPKGVWMVDLLSSRGVVVNGVACRETRLEDGDILQVGTQTIRLIYGGLAGSPGYRAAARPERPGFGPLLPAPIERSASASEPLPSAALDAWELIPEMILRQLPDRESSISESSSGSFNHALLMLIRLLGDMHRDHLEVVREELDQIRHLTREMGSLRAQLPRPDQAGGNGAASAVVNGERADPIPREESDTRSVPENPPHTRPDPQAMQAMVGERLAVWERERQSRWRKVLDLLVKP